MTPKKLRRTVIRWLTYATMVWAGLQLVAWKMSQGHEGSNRFSRTSIFFGNEFTSVAAGLNAGSVTAILGGISLDLTGVELDEAGADLTLKCHLAGISIQVPPGWRVTGVEPSRLVAIDVADPSLLPEDAPELRVSITQALGTIAISA